MEKNTIYRGYFRGRTNKLYYRVDIEFNRDNTAAGQNIVSIGKEGDDILFSGDDTVEITSGVNNTFDTLYSHSATIRLLVKGDHPEFYVSDYRKIGVSIYCGTGDTPTGDPIDSQVLFAGYVMPMSFEQSYEDTWDILELNCIDMLASLKYRKYKGTTNETTYKAAVAQTKNRSLNSILTEAFFFDETGADQKILPRACGEMIFWDASIGKTNDIDVVRQTFTNMYVFDKMFLGEEYGDVKTYEDIVTNILQYLNLKAVMHNGYIFLFNPSTVKDSEIGRSANFYKIDDATVRYVIDFNVNTTEFTDKEEEESIFAGGSISNSISRDEVFNRIMVKADLSDSVDDIIDDPIDSDDLTSDYQPIQYCNQYFTWGNGSGSQKAMYYMLWDRAITLPDVQAMQPWYMRIMKMPNWSCNIPKFYFNDQIGNFLNYMTQGKAAFLALDKTNVNSDMEKYLAVNIGAGGNINIQNAKYTSPAQTASLDPAQGGVNWILLSGSIKVTLAKALQLGMSVYKSLDPWHPQEVELGKLYRKQIRDKFTEYGLTRDGESDWRYFDVKAYTYKVNNVYRHTIDMLNNNGESISNDMPIPPDTDYTRQTYKFQNAGLTHVLNARLKIGNKYVAWNGSSYYWTTTPTTFPIFITVNADDYITGKKWDFTNFNNGMLGIEGEGLLIPIHYNEGIQGIIEFEIVSTNNCTVAWGDATANLWSVVDYLLIGKLEMKVLAGSSSYDEFAKKKDIVYYSDTNEAFFNEKEISLPINTSLTDSERADLGVTNEKVWTCCPLWDNGTTLEKLTTLYECNTFLFRKPEKMLVDALYREHSVPRVEIEIEAEDSMYDEYNLDNFHYWRRWKCPQLGDKLFLPYSISKNLQREISTIKAKEVDRYREPLPTEEGEEQQYKYAAITNVSTYVKSK